MHEIYFKNRTTHSQRINNGGKSMSVFCSAEKEESDLLISNISAVDLPLTYCVRMFFSLMFRYEGMTKLRLYQ